MNLIMDAAFLGSLYRYADDDVNTWIREVEERDGQTLEREITDALNTLVTGIKADGDWNGINTLVVLNAARTLSGMSVAVKGTYVGNLFNISSGDLVRGRGLTGNGVDKWGNTDVAQNAYGSTTSAFLGAHLSNWAARTPSTGGQGLIGAVTGSDFSRMILGGADCSPTSTLSQFGQRLWSAGSLIGPAVGGSGFGNNIVVAVTRSSGNVTTTTYSPTPTNTTTAANTAATANATTHTFLLNNTAVAPNAYANGAIASYVMSSDGQAAADRVMPRLAAFTATLRTFFGN